MLYDVLPGPSTSFRPGFQPLFEFFRNADPSLPVDTFKPRIFILRNHVLKSLQFNAEYFCYLPGLQGKISGFKIILAVLFNVINNRITKVPDGIDIQLLRPYGLP